MTVTKEAREYSQLLLSIRVSVQLVAFCYKDIHVDRIENEHNKRVSSCPQSTTSDSLTVNMTQQIEMRAIEMATEMARRSL